MFVAVNPGDAFEYALKRRTLPLEDALKEPALPLEVPLRTMPIYSQQEHLHTAKYVLDERLDPREPDRRFGNLRV